MAKRRHPPPADVQSAFAWTDPARVLDGVPAGEVLYEAPELRPRSRPRPRRAKSGRTLGLPFGVREADGHTVCWSCGSPVAEETAVRVGPGDSRCPGCGAKLPFF